VVVPEHILHLLNICKAAIDYKVEVRERLLQLEDPGVLQGWDRSVLLRIEALQVGFARVDDELRAATLHADDTNEINDVIPRVEVVHTQAALYGHRDGHLSAHLSDNARDQMRVFHQDCAKRAFNDFVGRASTVDVNFIVAELLGDFGSLAHSDGVTATDLTHDRVLVIAEGEEAVASLASMQHRILVDHLSVQPRVLRQQSHEVPEVFIADIDHWGDREVLPVQSAIDHIFARVWLRFLNRRASIGSVAVFSHFTDLALLL